MTWVSASEGGKFAEVMKKATEEIRKLGPMEQIKRSNKW
jgi:coenzyme F420-reducing hydrogenase delta subunit